jgi:hypothetical protein
VTRRAALVPLGVGVLMAVFYVLYAPHTADLAAQTARAELFRNSGYVPFWSGWYAGISTSSYSLVTPPLLGLLGAVGLGVASLLATSVVAGPLVRGARRPLLAGVLLVIAAGLDVISGRATFAAGSAVALLCLLALDRNRPVCSLLLAALATATSPVAGLLVLLAALGVAAADSSRRRSAVTAAAGALAVLAALQLLSIGDGSGYQPFSFLSMLMAVGVAVLVALCPVSARVRAAACVVVVALVAVYFVHSPVGANATRIVVLGAAPAIAGSARLSRRLLVVPVVLASLLPVAQLYNDVHATHHDGSAKSFAAPLVRQLAADPMAWRSSTPRRTGRRRTSCPRSAWPGDGSGRPTSRATRSSTAPNRSPRRPTAVSSTVMRSAWSPYPEGFRWISAPPGRRTSSPADCPTCRRFGVTGTGRCTT